MRYAAPAYLTIVNAVAEEAMSAETPKAAATTWTSPPSCTPSIEVTPARRPCARLRVTM